MGLKGEAAGRARVGLAGGEGTRPQFELGRKIFLTNLPQRCLSQYQMPELLPAL